MFASVAAYVVYGSLFLYNASMFEIWEGIESRIYGNKDIAICKCLLFGY